MDDLVKRADEVLKGVTPGPWWTNGKYSGSEMGCAIIAARTDCGPLPGNPTRGMVAWASAVLNTKARECEANARFIAAARELIPAMRDRIEADAKRIEKGVNAELLDQQQAMQERIAELDKHLSAICEQADRPEYSGRYAELLQRIAEARAALGEKADGTA